MSASPWCFRESPFFLWTMPWLTVCVCVCLHAHVCVSACMIAQEICMFLKQMAQSKKIYQLIFFWLEGKQTGFTCSVLIRFASRHHTHTYLHTHTRTRWTLDLVTGLSVSVFIFHTLSVCLPASAAHMSIESTSASFNGVGHYSVI